MSDSEEQFDGPLFAVIDNRGIVGLDLGSAWMPLVFTDDTKLPSVRILAQAAANKSGKPVLICRFDGCDLLETIQPN